MKNDWDWMSYDATLTAASKMGLEIAQQAPADVAGTYVSSFRINTPGDSIAMNVRFDPGQARPLVVHGTHPCRVNSGMTVRITAAENGYILDTLETRGGHKRVYMDMYDLKTGLESFFIVEYRLWAKFDDYDSMRKQLEAWDIGDYYLKIIEEEYVKLFDGDKDAA